MSRSTSPVVTDEQIDAKLREVVAERVDLALSPADVRANLLARGYSLEEARERLLESTYQRLSLRVAVEGARTVYAGLVA